jgi:hypothetical protein
LRISEKKRLTEAREKLLYRKTVLQIVELHYIYTNPLECMGESIFEKLSDPCCCVVVLSKSSRIGRVERLRLMLIGYAVRLNLTKKRVDSPSTIAAT